MTLVRKKIEKDFHSRPTLKSKEMVMEQLTYNDMQDAHSGTACLFHGLWEAKCWAAGLLMSQPLIHGLTFQRVWLFYLISPVTIYSITKIKSRSSKPLILGKPLDNSCFNVQMENLYISFPPHILLYFIQLIR